MAKFDDEKGSRPSGGGMFRALGRFMAVLLAIALILSVTFCLAVRTDGFRSFAEESLGKRLGLEMTLKEARVGFPPALVIEEPVSKAVEPGGKPVLAAQEASIAPNLSGGWILSVERGRLNVARTDSDGWNPAFFNRVGELPSRNLAEISRIMRKCGKRLTLHVSDAAINWMEKSGEAIASATGIFLDVTPIEIPERQMRHHHLSVYRSSGADGSGINDIEREWLSSETKDYIELERSGSPVSGADARFWEPGGAEDKEHLKEAELQTTQDRQ